MDNLKRTAEKQFGGELSIEESEAIRHLEDGFKILAGIMVKAIITEVHKQTNRFLGEVEQPLNMASEPRGQVEKLTYSVPEVAKLLGLSRPSVYEAVKTKQIPSINFGRRIFIPRTALKRMLNEISANSSK